MQGTWMVLLPAIIVLISATFYRNIVLALILGVLSAAFIATNFSLSQSLDLAFSTCKHLILDVNNLFLFAFLLIIGTIVSLITATGGAHAFGEQLAKRLKSAKDVEIATLLVPYLVFIDDYLNCLTVGHVMHPLTDKFKIPRTKLAFYIDAMTTPLAIITPISSWAGTVVSQLAMAGISINLNDRPVVISEAFYAYLKTLPFTFYSFIMIASAWIIASRRISYGRMYKHEQIAYETGNVFGGKQPAHEAPTLLNQRERSPWDLLLPIFTIVITVIGQILHQGGYWMLGGHNSLILAFQEKYNIFLILFTSGLLAAIVSFGFAAIREKILIKHFPQIITKGIKMMWVAILIVLLAWSFGLLLRENLHTGDYLASLLLNKISLNFLPLMLFLTTLIIATLTGSAWGSIAIMVPIAIPIILTFLNVNTPIPIAEISFLFPCLGAVFSGAAAGDHISPISDTTIMSDRSAGTHHADHVKTRLEYAWPALISTALAFIISGFVFQYHPALVAIISIASGIALCTLILYTLNKRK